MTENAKNESSGFLVVESWMTRQLGLGGNELLIYALIYSFTRKHGFLLSRRSYIASWAGCSLSTVDAHITALVKKGLVIKSPMPKNQTTLIRLEADIEKYTAAIAAENGIFEDDLGSDEYLGSPSWNPGYMSRNPGGDVTDSGNNTYYNTNYSHSMGHAPARAKQARGTRKYGGNGGNGGYGGYGGCGRSGGRGHEETYSSFDTDEFFQAAMHRSFGDDA